VLTNEPKLYRERRAHRDTQGDPTEGALLVGRRAGLDPERCAAHEVVEELPFEPERQYSASVRAGGRRARAVRQGRSGAAARDVARIR
jgi:magnesium-transporting ATPase (P-type)